MNMNAIKLIGEILYRNEAEWESLFLYRDNKSSDRKTELRD